MESTTKAKFSFLNYYFTKAKLNFTAMSDEPLSLSFSPKGKYNQERGLFALTLCFEAKQGGKSSLIEIECESLFQFESPIKLEQIPNYFYPNTLAIVFPYIRSFVSTLTLQSNQMPLVLPTMNLLSLQDSLKANTQLSEYDDPAFSHHRG